MQGYTIPLDKRLAADGRGLQEVTLNKKHMDMSLALAGAEDAARRETELQARLQSEMKQREKQRKEEHLRKLAASARAGAPTGTRSLASRLEEEEEANGAAGAAPYWHIPIPIHVASLSFRNWIVAFWFSCPPSAPVIVHSCHVHVALLAVLCWAQSCALRHCRLLYGITHKLRVDGDM